MEEQLISFETAKLAFEKGFPQEPNKLRVPYYNYKGEIKGDVTEFLKRYLKKEDTTGYENISAPTQSLLQKWLREVHKISVCIDFRHSDTNKIEGINSVYYDINIYRLHSGDAYKIINMSQISDIYEKALEIGLQQALGLIPQAK